MASRVGNYLEHAGVKSYPWARAKRRKPVSEIARWNVVRGDKVVVVNGRHRGQSGIVQHVLRKQNRLIVENVNVRQRMLYAPGDEERVKVRTAAPASVHYSNVNLVCPVTNLPTRVARRFLDDGTRVRVATRSGAIIEMPEILKERHTKKANALPGAKDTPEEDVLEVTYDAAADRAAWGLGLDEDGRRLF